MNISSVLETLLDNRDLGETAAAELLRWLIDPEVSVAAKGAALVALRAKGETPAEVRAMALALRILTEGGDSIRDSVEHGFRRVLARRPTAREAGHLEAVFRRELQRFHADPTGAKTLVGGVRGFPIPTDTDRVQLASWFYVATILLNLDETITKG